MKVKLTRLVGVLCMFCSQMATSQNLPDQWSFDKESHLLTTGSRASTGLYDESVVKEIRLYFPQTNYWTLLTQNYSTKKDLLASLSYDGETFDSIGVRFKGQTSYGMGGNSQKKSFNISMDFVRPDQQLGGYKTLNLNNSFEDASFMREVFYYHNIRKHAPSAQANFVRLYINDQDWGIYQNVQQLNKDFLEEWWLSNDGSNFRADSPTSTFGGGGPGGGGGPSWGDGTAAMNYLGEDTTLYQKYYTLKSTDSAYAWDELIEACMVLNQTPIADLPNVLSSYFDLDRTLWHLAGEVLFADDDSYIYKGKMDYYLYRDAETGRITVYDYDGNSVMKTQNATWSPFYNETKVNYPLMNRLLANPHLRQRYLAHLRVLTEEYFDDAKAAELIDQYAARINDMVQADPKKRTTYAQFVTEQQNLKNFIKNRKTTLLNNAEFKLTGPTIADVSFTTSETWKNPVSNEAVKVFAKVQHTNGVGAVKLYYATGLYGGFVSTAMYDDGNHGDATANDGIYAGELPGYEVGTYVRFYIEAATNNTAGTLSYYPKGADHDVIMYQVEAVASQLNDVVINEFMSSNANGPKDENDQNEDWIELYNKSSNAIDLSGFYLSDNPANIKKWEIPSGTSIGANGYLIFWCDEDQEDGVLHTNFKLSAAGETIYLADKAGAIVDSITYSNATEDLSTARIPNGTGPFKEGSHTFNANNTPVATYEVDAANALVLYPNPATSGFTVKQADGELLTITNLLGQTIWKGLAPVNTYITTSEWQEGIYIVSDGVTSTKLMIHR